MCTMKVNIMFGFHKESNVGTKKKNTGKLNIMNLTLLAMCVGNHEKSGILKDLISDIYSIFTTARLFRAFAELIVTLYTITIYLSVHNQLCKHFSRDGLYIHSGFT